jgi:hypothetical protein
VDGRHRGEPQHRAQPLWWAIALFLVVAVPLGVIALLTWLLVFVATQGEQSAVLGLVMLGAAIGTFVQDRGRSASRWLAASLALLAAGRFMDAAMSQRHEPLAYTVVSDGIWAIAAACAGTGIVLKFRSGRLRSRRPSWLRRAE